MPDTPTGELTGKGQVRLDWNDVAGADSYDVRYFDDQWVELPTSGISIVFNGSGGPSQRVEGLGPLLLLSSSREWGRCLGVVGAQHDEQPGLG